MGHPSVVVLRKSNSVDRVGHPSSSPYFHSVWYRNSPGRSVALFKEGCSAYPHATVDEFVAGQSIKEQQSSTNSRFVCEQIQIKAPKRPKEQSIPIGSKNRLLISRLKIRFLPRSPT